MPNLDKAPGIHYYEITLHSGPEHPSSLSFHVHRCMHACVPRVCLVPVEVTRGSPGTGVTNGCEATYHVDAET